MAVSKPIHPLAELYGFWALNPLVEVARVLSFDVTIRPQHYPVLNPKLSDTLMGFRFKVGNDPEWPDLFQRTLNFKPMYHVSLATPQLREAALRYMEAPSDVARQAFRVAAEACQSQLATLEGHGLELTVTQARAIFTRALSVLREPSMTQAFSKSAAPAQDWPLGGNFSREAADMVANLTRGLGVIFCLGGGFKRFNRASATLSRPLVPEFTVALSADRFLKLQRAGHHGNRTLSLLLEEKGLDSDELIRATYQWTKALQSLVPDVARAWKDVEYRCQLSDLEWGMAPNPAGDMVPATTSAALAFSTSTVHGEICCCSGDLDCDPTSQLSDFCSEYQCTA